MGENRTSSNIELRCDFCGGAEAAHEYEPAGTLRAARVWVCAACGLVQTVYGEDRDPRIPSPSCDANWGNIRHGKGLRLGAAETLLLPYLPRVKTVLDVGANRGDFLWWLIKQKPGTQITAVEPDSRVVGAYQEHPSISSVIVARLEEVELEPGRYDLIYCSHTLEHAASAAMMLQQMHEALSDEGLLFLEVPNLASIGKADLVEEFFMDKHSYHFDRLLLRDFITSAGFTILAGESDADPYYITFLLRKAEKVEPFRPPRPDHPNANADLLARYARQLTANRESLRCVVQEKLLPFVSRQKIAFWGASRIFDALVRYGGLSTAQVDLLVDSYIGEYLPEIHGVAIRQPEAIKAAEPQVVIILARSSQDVIAEQVRRLGVRHTMKFDNLLAQCRAK